MLKAREPARIIDIEVVLNDPALGELQRPAVGGLVAKAFMMRAGSRAFSTTTTASGSVPLKYGSTNSSRRPFGASKIGTFRFADHDFSHC